MPAAFAEDLRTWGPQAGERPALSLEEAEAWCRRLARSHYENFPLVSRLLPRRLRQHFYNVYAYCRWADDLADEVQGSEQSLALLGWWREELDACYARLGGGGGKERGRGGDRGQGTGDREQGGHDEADPSSLISHPSSLILHPSSFIAHPSPPPHPVFVALSRTIAECSIPHEPFADLISAFEQDQRVFRYDTFEQLRDYCRSSADPVGRLVLYVCGEHTEEHGGWSDSICTGLQLANFWQDVARDYDLGRVYLPREDRDRFGYTPEDLESQATNAAFVKLMRFEVDRAREFLQAGLPLVKRLPGRLQIDVDLFARGGLKILERIERIDYRVWDRRPVVTKCDAAGLLAASVWRWLRRGRGMKDEG